jgi:hypothetical protein
MLEPEPDNHMMNRPEFRAGASAVLGGVVGGLIVLVIVLLFADCGDGDDDEGAVATAPAATATQVPDDGETPQPAASPTVTGTPAGPTDPVEALEAFLQEEFGEAHIGDCPQEVPPGGPPDGYCSIEIASSDEVVTYFVGPPFSEAAGEVVLTRQPDSSWEADFVPAPPLGETIAVGQEAMVYGVGSCLNFREAPNGNAPVVTCRLDGTSANVAEGPVVEGSVTWWRLEGLGWGSGQFLARTP